MNGKNSLQTKNLIFPFLNTKEPKIIKTIQFLKIDKFPWAEELWSLEVSTPHGECLNEPTIYKCQIYQFINWWWHRAPDVSRRVDPELYSLSSPVLLQSKLRCHLAQQVDNCESHFWCSVYGVLGHAIGDSTHLNTECWNSWPVVIIWFTKGQNKHWNCAGKLNIIPVRLVLLSPRYLSHFSHKTIKAATKLLYVLCRWKQSGTPEVARLQFESNCYNHPCKDYGGKKWLGGIRLPRLK